MHIRYMDEASFMAHSASRQFLDGYAVVMDPSLHYTVPSLALAAAASIAFLTGHESGSANA
jgi:hypothetical protein